jgi:hypothetical protein
MTRLLLTSICACVIGVGLAAQGAGAPPAARSARDAAPVDLTGSWVSVVTEDWRWRMVMPLKGDAASVPITTTARKIVDAWDPAKDEAAGLQCKAFGAPGLMRIPGRLRISWQNDDTLKIEADAGTQTRLFHFGAQPPRLPPASWQGYSTATWDTGGSAGGFGLGIGIRQAGRPRSLEVVTTNLRPGYLRRNGVPYSSRAKLTEYYERFSEPNGDEWFTVITIVEDPEYLYIPFVTTTDFKKEQDASRWSPSACTAR